MAGQDGTYGLRQLRRDRGLTLQAISVLSGITAAEVSMLERGLIGQPKPETIVRLARALGIGAYRMRDILAATAKAEDTEAEPAGADS